jgi:hypothetical protein
VRESRAYSVLFRCTLLLPLKDMQALLADDGEELENIKTAVANQLAEPSV